MTVLLSIVFVLVVIGILVAGLYYNSSTVKGKVGEAQIHNLLLRLPDEYTIFDDVVYKTQQGTTQIDHVVVSKYGVFVIETKNYRGEIYGDDNRKKWTQIIVTDVTYSKKWYKTYTYVTKNRFYNPVKQSLTHSYVIKDYLKEWPYLKVIPIVVFVGSAVFKDVETKYHVVYDFDLIDTILKYRTSYLSDSDVQKVVDLLSIHNMREFVDDKTHVKNIKDARLVTENKISSGICPKCGGTLVRRNGKYGSFWGCSNYPKCRFTTQ